MRAHALLAVAVLLLAGCSSNGGGGATPGPASDSGRIDGVVVDQAITPIAGARIELSGPQGLAQNTTTGGDGRFTFTDLEPGDYFVSAGKPGYDAGVRVATTVVAGEDDPPTLRMLLNRIAFAAPNLQHYKLEGYYTCAFALAFITDSCEFGYRTAWDELNATTGPPPTARSILQFENTQLIDVSGDVFTIVQEGFWESDSVATFWIMVDETPIDNSCDCSDTYGNRIGPSPLLNRLDRYAMNGSEEYAFSNDADIDEVGGFPLGKTVASRGFLPFQHYPTDSQDPGTWASTALSFQFVVITTTFHNYQPDPAWTFETSANFPVG